MSDAADIRRVLLEQLVSADAKLEIQRRDERIAQLEQAVIDADADVENLEAQLNASVAWDTLFEGFRDWLRYDFREVPATNWGWMWTDFAQRVEAEEARSGA